ncbi:TRAP transporter substrate-binding protein DctP [Aliivibrio kagoshimensis]|jgi:TRAP-type C4-dicarboxylate transport system substrate-binding protein|uniref:TRAP transporter substrate-binding protein DctP n=1 Tax=Aliivibrio kagoshimensis TaxID=2910230 RepID=UPI003D0959C7
MQSKSTIVKTAKSTLLGTAMVATLATSSVFADDFILSQSYPTDHIFHMTAKNFMSNLQATGSEYEPAYHSGGDLGSWESQFEQAMDGVIPMTITYGASEFDNRLDLTWLGYVVDDWKSAKAAYGPEGEMLGIYNEIFNDIGLQALGIVPTGFGSIAVRKGVGKVPVNFPEDGKGIKMRTATIQIGVDRFNDLGFAAVPIPYGELYTSLQLGVIDARATAPAVEIWQMRDVLETYILTKDYFEQAFILVNKEWWDDLPTDERAKFQTAIDKTMTWVWNEAQSIDEGYLQKVKDSGINVVELTEDQMNKSKAIIYANEWPKMEKLIGPDIMNKLTAIAKPR